MPSLELSLKPDAVRNVVGSWTPADIANLSGFFHFTEGNCYVSNGGAATAIDGVVGYVPSLFGGTLSASEATNKPTLKADGLQFATTSDVLNLSADFVGDAMTLYLVGKWPATSSMSVLGHPTEFAWLTVNTGGLALQDDGFNGAASASLPDNTSVLVRYDQVSGSGAFVMHMTGAGETSSGTVIDTSTYGTIGKALGGGGPDSDADGRLNLIILINRCIAYNSAEDLLIRAWITTNVGVSL